MPKVTVTRRDGEVVEIDAKGRTLMEAMRIAGIEEILGLCGGSAACATCHVYMEPEYMERLTPMREQERELLESVETRRENSRLSCQVRVNERVEGLHMTVAPED